MSSRNDGFEICKNSTPQSQLRPAVKTEVPLGLTKKSQCSTYRELTELPAGCGLRRCYRRIAHCRESTPRGTM